VPKRFGFRLRSGLGFKLVLYHFRGLVNQFVRIAKKIGIDKLGKIWVIFWKNHLIGFNRFRARQRGREWNNKGHKPK